MEHPCPQSEADLEMQDCAQQHVVTVAGSMVMGLPLNVQTFQVEQYHTPKPMDKIYWLPVLSPTKWEARHIAWRSPLWLRIRASR